MIEIGSFKPLFDNGQILILAQRAVIVGVRGGEVLATQSTPHFGPAERPVVIDVELVEYGRGCFLDFVQVKRPVAIGVDRGERAGTKRSHPRARAPAE